MKIRFTRSIALEGEHCEDGTTREVSEAIASLLITSGDAISFFEVETAEAPLSARETATIPTKKAKRKS